MEKSNSLEILLNKIQKNLKAHKSQINNFGNFKYRSCEDIIEAVKPHLGDAILLLSDEITLLGDRFYVKANASISLNGNTITTSAFAREANIKKGMDDSQITGSASSYARKYALSGLFALDDTQDADTRNNNEQKNNEDNKILNEALMALDGAKSKDEIKNIYKMYKGKGSNIENAIIEFGVNFKESKLPIG